MAKSSFVRCIRLTVIVGLIGGALYAAWELLGRPDSVQDVKDAIKNITGGNITWPDFPDIDLPDDWDFGDFGDAIENLTGFVDEWLNDPYVGNNETYYWQNDKKGLSLELWYACDETWQDEYAAAVKDWEEGDPDALTLTTKQVEVDNECTPQDGVMKVCNGNYGETGWLGINELMLINDGQIQSSVAKMNEHYLLNADIYERQYTMCHEIGHGFGLPHTDENFYNRDLGNCMDYTDSPENNLHPDTGNYNTLASLYGVVGSRRYLKETSSTNSSQLVEKIPPTVMHFYKAAMKEFIERSKKLEGEKQNIDGWRLLGKHAGGEKYGRRLTQGYTLEVNVLLATRGLSHEPESL